MDDGISTVPLDLQLCPVRKEEPINVDDGEEHMEVGDPETPMEVDLDDHDRCLIHLLETNLESDSE